MAAILNFSQKLQNKKCLYLETVLDRPDYADFGCHNSIRLKAEHFLNTLALTLLITAKTLSFIFFLQAIL